MRRIRFVVACACLLIAVVGSPAAASAEERTAEVAAEILRLRQASLERELVNHQRVLRVGIPIARAAVALCDGRERPYLGLVAATRHEVWEPLREAAAALWQVGKGVRVIWVEPGSPADRAGVRAGDELLEIDGRDLRFASELHGPRMRLGDGPFRLSVHRENALFDASVAREPACVGATGVAQSDVPNAFMKYNGRLTLTSAMLRLLPDDDDLAVLIGHEIAHFLLRHRSGQGEEAEADYLGLYLAARAGHSIEGAPALWRRFAVLAPDSLDVESYASHPSSPRRALLLDRTIDEIRARIARGEPLVPAPAP